MAFKTILKVFHRGKEVCERVIIYRFRFLKGNPFI